jgi:hypothetical protein
MSKRVDPLGLTIEIQKRDERIAELERILYGGASGTWTREGSYQQIRGKECLITLEPRPGYCDRGRFIAKLFPEGKLAREIDWADGWPRYYFDLARAKAEIEAWLVARKQL